MKNKLTKNVCFTALLLALFLVWTALVCVVDRQPVGPEGSVVGFAALNVRFHALTGEHPALYKLTELLGLLPFAVVGCFALLGAVQFIKRKSLFKVDADIIALGLFYLLVLGCYALFEIVVVNYRPVLIEGELEASYPSSHTMLALTVLLTAAMQAKKRLSNKTLRLGAIAALAAVAVLIVAARLFSGVHWLTDIIGGVLLSAALLMGYAAALHFVAHGQNAQ